MTGRTVSAPAPTSGGRPTVGLALIARDEEATLPRLPAGCDGAFDEVVLILETGDHAFRAGRRFGALRTFGSGRAVRSRKRLVVSRLYVLPGPLVRHPLRDRRPALLPIHRSNDPEPDAPHPRPTHSHRTRTPTRRRRESPEPEASSAPARPCRWCTPCPTSTRRPRYTQGLVTADPSITLRQERGTCASRR
jgi:hypothetical protein